MIGANCKYYLTNANYRKVIAEVKQALGEEYKFDIFKSVADTFKGHINDLTADYVIKNYPRKNLESLYSPEKTGGKNLSDKIQKHQGYWSRKEVDANPRILYVFTDNTDRDSGSDRIPSDSWYAKKYGQGHHYPKSTTAVIRGKKNARPISTVKWFYKNHEGVTHPRYDRNSAALWHDSDVQEFKKVVREELQEIVEEFNTGNYDTIMFPGGDGLFNAEISDISKSRTPELYKALCDLLTEFGFESLIPTSKTSKPNKKAEQQGHEGRWAVRAAEGSYIEVSSAGDEFGRQFSALGAVLAEGTTLSIKIGGKKGKVHTFDVGGYSIEAAYQMIKGYRRNPKGSLIDKNGNLIKINGRTIHIEGKDKSPISDVLKIVSYNRTASTKEQRENHSYNMAYLPLWQLWAEQNPELIEQLRERAGEEKILTDRFSSRTVVSQARALSEILWGTPSVDVSKYNEKKYAQEREQAIAASEAIPKDVNRKDAVNTNKIKIIDRKSVTDKQVEYLSNGRNVRGEIIKEGDKDSKGYMIAFRVETTGMASMNANLNYFSNPFEGQKDAIKKFIQWIIPNSVNSLPKELRSEELDRRRNFLRTFFSKGGYTAREILSDNSPENILYARTLRYIIDNFRTLRQRYNPIDIQEFGDLKHKVKVIFDNASEAPSDAVIRLSPKESVADNSLDDSNSVRIDRYDSREKENPDQYVITFPSSFETIFSAPQRERIIKTLAAAVPEGATVTLNADVASEGLINSFNRVVKYGYNKVALKQVTLENGSLTDVGIYQRREYTNSQVERRDYFTPKSVKENYSQEPYFFIFENAQDDQLKETSATIPTWHDNRRQASSYLNDEKDFEWFKGRVDSAIERAKKVIDDGGKVVIPKAPMGSSASALEHYAPRCYEYVNSRLRELVEYGNRGETAQKYMSSETANVPVIEGNPAESINLDVEALQNPRATLYQRFTNTEILDLANYYREIFVDALHNSLPSLKKDYQKKISEEKDKNEKARLQYKYNKLVNPETQYLEALNIMTVQEIQNIMRRYMEGQSAAAKNGKASKISAEGASLVDASLNTKGFFELLFNYSIPLIEDSIGIRITATQNAERIKTDAEIRDQAEDVAGEDSPEMGWSYNHRLVDPFKSLTYSVRRMLNSIEMRDPNDLRIKIKDTLGRPKTYNSSYIYASIMSRMSKMTLGEIDNFMTITPVSELSEKEARKFPLGKPVFPVLEGMKYQYPWANDLIAKLAASYNINVLKLQYPGMTVEQIQADKTIMATLGNTASQFYTNFCQNFVSYATMVNGKIIEENKSIGEASLKQSAINNYEGNVRFPGIAMVYNSDSTVNNENIQKQIDETQAINKLLSWTKVKGDTPEFWVEIKRLQKDYNADSLYEAWEACSREQKKFISRITNTLKASGLQFSDFDIFCIAMDNHAKHGIMEMMSEYELCLKSIAGLAKGEHMFESSRYTEFEEQWSKDKMEHHTPRFYWNKFFEKFGDRVTEREHVDSTRILGKSRYSYVYPSYMSMTLNNLTNPDIEARKRYIEENYMPYAWFYDKATDKFRNKFLEDMYNGASWDTPSKRSYASGHDLLVKKDGYDEKEYQDWSPEDIMQLMLSEQNQPTDRSAACYIIPALSDSQICKAIQAPKIEIGQALVGMRNVVLQEIDRMDLVERRNIIFRMQDYEDMLNDEREDELSKDDKAYINKYQEFYDIYKMQHPERLEKVENFDDNGKDFCFFPELNDYKISLGIATSKNNPNPLMLQVIQVLSSNPSNPKRNEIGLKDAIKALQKMSEESFDAKATAVGLVERRYGDYIDSEGQPQFGEYYSAATKEETINNLIEDALRRVMSSKINNFIYEKVPTATTQGILNEQVLNAVLKEDGELMAKYNSLPQATENHELNAKEIQEVNDFYNAVYKKIEKFYWAHTFTMSQFLQLMVTDLAYYKNPKTFFGSVDFGKRFKEVYGAGMKLNTNSKYGKKIERSIILRDSVRRSASMGTLESVLQRAVDEGRIDEYEKDAVLDKFKGIKGTDAQAYRSLTSWRDIMDMIGKCDQNITTAIENLRNNRWTMGDFYTVFQTIKPFTYGPENQDSGIDDIHMRTMVHHKNSEAVLLALYNTLVGSAEGDANYSPRLRGLNRAMEEIELVDENGEVMKYSTGEHMKAIDVAQYHSAVKVGAHGIIDINYSRKKLKEIQDEGVITVAGKNFRVGKHESYYSIAKRLGNAVDAKAISEEEYNRVMDMLEPDENEVFEIIKQSIYKNGDESLGYNDQVLHKIPYAYYSIQQPTPNHYTDNKEGTFGSQPRHMIMADLPEDFEVTINGKKYNREQIRERYSGLLVANLLQCYEEDIEPLFNDVDKKKTPAQRLHDRLKPLIEGNPKYSQSLSDALEVDENGEFVMPLNNLTVAHQLEEILTSLFKNAIHRQHINGGNAIIAADEGVGYSKRLKIRGKRDSEGKLTSIEGIECLLPAHAKEMLKPFLVKKTKVIDGETIEYWELDPKKLEEAGLEKAIGYRIPTEGLYSIMPLIIRGFLPQQSGSSIVLAQEVTTLTGSDNDVDKLFLMLKRASKKMQAIKAPSGAHPLDMTKEQRDNEIIDIFYSITTHKDMSHLWLNPGNFDNLKMEAQKNKILKNRYLREKFMVNAGISPTDLDKLADLFTEDSYGDYTALYRRVMEVPADKKLDSKTLLDVVVDFTGKYQRPLSPVYPDTFIKMHQMYMAGVAEKGIYANNTLDHAKLQWVDINLSDSTEFIFNGQRVKKIDERYIIKTRKGRKYRHYISKDCSECSAASVDNGKDPQLDDINSNKQTATFFGFLLRLGLGLDGAGALMAQPLVDYAIRSQGNINTRMLKNAIREIETWLKDNGFELSDDRFNWQTHNFSVREWHMNTMNGNFNYLKTRGTGAPNMERIVSLYCTYNLILKLVGANQDMQAPRTILHYDSPTHAADTSFGGVVAQTKAVEEVNKRSNSITERGIYGEENIVVYNLEKKAQDELQKEGGKTLKDLSEAGSISPSRRLYDRIMASQIPITQGFYTLGIEKIRNEFRNQFVFGREEMQNLVDVLWDYMEKMNIYSIDKKIKIMSQMFNDWVVYRLSKTSLFGDDGNMTYDQKRQYYLYQFPGEFMRLKEEIPELNAIEATRNMYVEKGIILMHRGQSTSTTMRDFITNSFDTLIQSRDERVQEVAKKLFMYTYYLNGFDFSYASFGNMMSTNFQTAFPEYIQALRDMNKEEMTSEDMDNFFNQMLVKRNRNGLLPHISYKSRSLRDEGLQKGYHDTGEEYDPDEDIPEYVIDVHISSENKVKTEVLRLNRAMSEIHNTIIYEPVRANSPFHFNANQTLDEMLDVVYDQDLIDGNRKVGAYKRNPEASRNYNYQNSKDMRELPDDRDANVPEPDANGKTANRSLNNVNFDSADTRKTSANLSSSSLEDRELDETRLAESAGIEVREVDPEKMVNSFTPSDSFFRQLHDSDEKTSGIDDLDIKEGEDIIKNNNNGKVPCV